MENQVLASWRKLWSKSLGQAGFGSAGQVLQVDPITADETDGFNSRLVWYGCRF
jgi:hypothetical protein